MTKEDIAYNSVVIPFSEKEIVDPGDPDYEKYYEAWKKRMAHIFTLAPLDEKVIAGYLKFHPENMEYFKKILEPNSMSLIKGYLEFEKDLKDIPNYSSLYEDGMKKKL